MFPCSAYEKGTSCSSLVLRCVHAYAHHARETGPQPVTPLSNGSLLPLRMLSWSYCSPQAALAGWSIDADPINTCCIWFRRPLRLQGATAEATTSSPPSSNSLILPFRWAS